MAMAGRLQKINSIQEGKRCAFPWDSLSSSPSSLGLLLKERICSLGEQILSIKSNPDIWSDTVSTIKLKRENDFLSVGGYGKLQNVREKSGSFEVDDKWQPCPCIGMYLDLSLHLPYISPVKLPGSIAFYKMGWGKLFRA